MVPGDEGALRFEVSGDPERMLRRRVSAAVAVAPRLKVQLWLFRSAGFLLIVAGVVFLVTNPFVGVLALVYGLVLLVRLGTPTAIRRRLEKVLRKRNRFFGEPYRIEADDRGFRHTSDTVDIWYAWARAVGIRTHEGGLLVTFDGSLAVLDIPPWAFPDDTSRAEAERRIAGWIAAAAVAA
jgi:hypothetical protein